MVSVSVSSSGAVLQGAGWARLNRLRSEETGDVGIREIQTESHVQRGLCIENSLSQSWEDLSLVVTPCVMQGSKLTSCVF